MFEMEIGDLEYCDFTAEILKEKYLIFALKIFGRQLRKKIEYTN